nr:amidohydrolase family protein [Nocardioides convexus]
MDERLASIERGRFGAADLLSRTTGRIAVGEPADLVTVDLHSPRTAGTGADEHTAVFAATAADVTQVVAAGRVVFDGDHGRVGRALGTAIERLWT